jgi:hypothetical protein
MLAISHRKQVKNHPEDRKRQGEKRLQKNSRCSYQPVINTSNKQGGRKTMNNNRILSNKTMNKTRSST